MLKKIVLLLVAFFMLVAYSFAANDRFTLVIDPGHGGHDAGAMGARSKEKDINLRVALAFGKYVERNMPDVRVIYTRKTDVFIPLKERANIANKAGADLFISVHTNALPGGKIARGFETYSLGMHRAKDNLDVAMRENSVISMEKGYQQTYQGFDPKSSDNVNKTIVNPIERRTAKTVEKGATKNTVVKAIAKVGEKDAHAPIFKVQIFVSNRVLRAGDAHFKGETGYASYQEGGMVKYTIGSSANYNEIFRLRKSLLDKFPEAFIIAFKDGQKYDVNQAIREFKQNKK